MWNRINFFFLFFQSSFSSVISQGSDLEDVVPPIGSLGPAKSANSLTVDVVVHEGEIVPFHDFTPGHDELLQQWVCWSSSLLSPTADILIVHVGANKTAIHIAIAVKKVESGDITGSILHTRILWFLKEKNKFFYELCPDAVRLFFPFFLRFEKSRNTPPCRQKH
jgi:hypothetical protein